MFAKQFGRIIRAARGARGLTQGELARRAKVSRTSLARLESASPGAVQTDILDRLCHAADLHLTVGLDPRQEERLRVRAEHRHRLDERRLRHYRLAVDLATNPEQAPALIARAQAVVELWQRRGTCSPDYWTRWQEILALPPARLAQRMTALGEWENALFQNSPWSWAWT